MAQKVRVTGVSALARTHGSEAMVPPKIVNLLIGIAALLCLCPAGGVSAEGYDEKLCDLSEEAISRIAMSALHDLDPADLQGPTPIICNPPYPDMSNMYWKFDAKLPQYRANLNVTLYIKCQYNGWCPRLSARASKIKDSRARYDPAAAIAAFETKFQIQLWKERETNRRSWVMLAEVAEILGSPLVGRNVEARLYLPAWIMNSGDTQFPPGKSIKPGELATVTSLGVYSQYPIPPERPAEQFYCRESTGCSTPVLVILLNGAQPRPQPATPQTGVDSGRRGDFADSLSETYDTVVSATGGLLDQIAANQRRARREAEREQEKTEQERARTKQQELDRAYSESGPEIVIWMDSQRIAAGNTLGLREELLRKLSGLVKLPESSGNP